MVLELKTHPHPHSHTPHTHSSLTPHTHTHYPHTSTTLHTHKPLSQQVLQHEIRKTHARNQKVEWVDDLVLMETIGKGGFGVVYKGSWKGSLAAIKVGWGGEGSVCCC